MAGCVHLALTNCVEGIWIHSTGWDLEVCPSPLVGKLSRIPGCTKRINWLFFWGFLGNCSSLPICSVPLTLVRECIPVFDLCFRSLGVCNQTESWAAVWFEGSTEGGATFKLTPVVWLSSTAHMTEFHVSCWPEGLNFSLTVGQRPSLVPWHQGLYLHGAVLSKAAGFIRAEN